jgi:hypothetical protein
MGVGRRPTVIQMPSGWGTLASNLRSSPVRTPRGPGPQIEESLVSPLQRSHGGDADGELQMARGIAGSIWSCELRPFGCQFRSTLQRERGSSSRTQMPPPQLRASPRRTSSNPRAFVSKRTDLESSVTRSPTYCRRSARFTGEAVVLTWPALRRNDARSAGFRALKGRGARSEGSNTLEPSRWLRSVGRGVLWSRTPGEGLSGRIVSSGPGGAGEDPGRCPKLDRRRRGSR